MKRAGGSEVFLRLQSITEVTMASFYRRIFRPVWNQFLTKVPGKKSIGQFARVAFDLMVPYILM